MGYRHIRKSPKPEAPTHPQTILSIIEGIIQSEDNSDLRTDEREAIARLYKDHGRLRQALHGMLAAWRHLGNDTPSLAGFELTVGEVAHLVLAETLPTK